VEGGAGFGAGEASVEEVKELGCLGTVEIGLGLLFFGVELV
jgi:Na+/phosphate symporter